MLINSYLMGHVFVIQFKKWLGGTSGSTMYQVMGETNDKVMKA